MDKKQLDIKIASCYGHLTMKSVSSMFDVSQAEVYNVWLRCGFPVYVPSSSRPFKLIYQRVYSGLWDKYNVKSNRERKITNMEIVRKFKNNNI